MEAKSDRPVSAAKRRKDSAKAKASLLAQAPSLPRAASRTLSVSLSDPDGLSPWTSIRSPAGQAVVRDFYNARPSTPISMQGVGSTLSHQPPVGTASTAAARKAVAGRAQNVAFPASDKGSSSKPSTPGNSPPKTARDCTMHVRQVPHKQRPGTAPPPFSCATRRRVDCVYTGNATAMLKALRSPVLTGQVPSTLPVPTTPPSDVFMHSTLVPVAMPTLMPMLYESSSTVAAAAANAVMAAHAAGQTAWANGSEHACCPASPPPSTRAAVLCQASGGAGQSTIHGTHTLTATPSPRAPTYGPHAYPLTHGSAGSPWPTHGSPRPPSAASHPMGVPLSPLPARPGTTQSMARGEGPWVDTSPWQGAWRQQQQQHPDNAESGSNSSSSISPRQAIANGQQRGAGISQPVSAPLMHDAATHVDRARGSRAALACAVDEVARRAEVHKAQTRHWQRTTRVPTPGATREFTSGTAWGSGASPPCTPGSMHGIRTAPASGRRPRQITLQVAPQTVDDWDMLLEQTRRRLMAQIDEVTSLTSPGSGLLADPRYAHTSLQPPSPRSLAGPYGSRPLRLSDGVPSAAALHPGLDHATADIGQPQSWTVSGVSMGGGSGSCGGTAGLSYREHVAPVLEEAMAAVQRAHEDAVAAAHMPMSPRGMLANSGASSCNLQDTYRTQRHVLGQERGTDGVHGRHERYRAGPVLEGLGEYLGSNGNSSWDGGSGSGGPCSDDADADAKVALFADHDVVGGERSDVLGLVAGRAVGHRAYEHTLSFAAGMGSNASAPAAVRPGAGTAASSPQLAAVRVPRLALHALSQEDTGVVDPPSAPAALACLPHDTQEPDSAAGAAGSLQTHTPASAQPEVSVPQSDDSATDGTVDFGRAIRATSVAAGIDSRASSPCFGNMCMGDDGHIAPGARDALRDAAGAVQDGLHGVLDGEGQQLASGAGHSVHILSEGGEASLGSFMPAAIHTGPRLGPGDSMAAGAADASSSAALSSVAEESEAVQAVHLSIRPGPAGSLAQPAPLSGRSRLSRSTSHSYMQVHADVPVHVPSSSTMQQPGQQGPGSTTSPLPSLGSPRGTQRGSMSGAGSVQLMALPVYRAVPTQPQPYQPKEREGGYEEEQADLLHSCSSPRGVPSDTAHSSSHPSTQPLSPSQPQPGPKSQSLPLPLPPQSPVRTSGISFVVVTSAGIAPVPAGALLSDATGGVGVMGTDAEAKVQELDAQLQAVAQHRDKVQDAARAARALSKTSPMLVPPGPAALQQPTHTTPLRMSTRSPPRSLLELETPVPSQHALHSTSPRAHPSGKAPSLSHAEAASLSHADVQGTAAAVGRQYVTYTATITHGGGGGMRLSPPPSPQRPIPATSSPGAKTHGSALPEAAYKMVQTKIGGALTHMQDIWNN